MAANRRPARRDGLVGVLLITAVTVVVDLEAALTDGEPVSAWIRRQPRKITMPVGVYFAYHFWAPERWRRHDPLGVLGHAISSWAQHHRLRGA